MTDNINNTWGNLLEDKECVTLNEYLEVYSSRITQESEILFVREFLYPILGSEKITNVIPQHPFIDSEGRNRRIDFGIIYEGKKVALEVNGETYHAEGIIPNEMFDDNLNRQNEILNAGWFLLRYSYSQLQSPKRRQQVYDSLFYSLRKNIPVILSQSVIEPNYLQREVLDALHYYRKQGWKKGIVILPTGTGKTYLSAFDSINSKRRILFIVHRLDILSQSKESFEKVYPNEILGFLSGEVKENVNNSKVLFASKDSLRNPDVLKTFATDEFDYIIIDEVHHGQAPTYQLILEYFNPGVFMLGLTATPDRMDRKDIFELFNYQKIYEYSLNDAIDNGFLVPYTYYGLKDNIDYSNIRLNGNKYNVADLDRNLIIKERNDKILEEYLEKGNSNKAIGFCCSIKHANSMEDFFTKNGIPSISITSETANREDELNKFRQSEYTIAFTVDLFNEGIDFPDLRVLLFLRPTESKTIFFQQLGRGLRLCGGKDNVVVIDFIGNYKKANNIRKYLSKGNKTQTNPDNGRVEKIIYEYSPKCDVIFEAEVEEILDSQDTSERDITKEDLIGAYYDLIENLKRKPTQSDINNLGEFKISRYLNLFGSWSNFLKEIGEHTEASYHFPQGTHLGHLLYIINTVGTGSINSSHLRPNYVRFSGGFTEGIDGFQRQVKYKLQAAMEMGILVDFRDNALSDSFDLIFTKNGKHLYSILTPLLKQLDFSFDTSGKTGELTWKMNCESDINNKISSFISTDFLLKNEIREIFLEMEGLSLFLRFLYSHNGKSTFSKSDIYNDFFEAPFVKDFLDRQGIEKPTDEGAKRRVPFLINLLEAIGIINQGRSDITLIGFYPSSKLLKDFISEESTSLSNEISKKLTSYFIGDNVSFDNTETTMLKEKFGAKFLTPEYKINII